MGFLDRLTGGGRAKKEVEEQHEPASATTSSQPSPAAAPSPINLSPQEEAIRAAATTSSSSPLLSTVNMNMPSSRLYNPYEGISTQIGTKPHAFRVPEGPEFVFEEEASVRRRDWTQHLQFYCGGGYLLGGAVGVASGLYRFVAVKPEITTDSLKLKTNRLLNSAGSFAKPFSNTCGVLGLYFSVFESLYVYQLEKAGLPDEASTVLAGFTSGALFRMPRGPRQAAVAGAVGMGVASGIIGLRKFFPSL